MVISEESRERPKLGITIASSPARYEVGTRRSTLETEWLLWRTVLLVATMRASPAVPADLKGAVLLWGTRASNGAKAYSAKVILLEVDGRLLGRATV